MTKVIARTVADMPPEQRRSFEQAIGEPLQPDESVFFMATTPSAPRDPETQHQAHQRLLAIMEKVAAYQKAAGITPDEAEAALDDVIDAVRRRRRT